ncbi:hypothetical protein FQZ97_941490 [compost metagenome]
MAAEQTFSAISEANSLAMEASVRHGRPASRRLAAWWTICRATAIWVAMSARRKATAWCSMIGLPKVLRSWA